MTGSFDRHQNPGAPIRLTRRFAIVCAIVVFIAGAVLAMRDRSTAIDQLTRMAERNNIDLTIAFANSIWTRYSSFVDQAHTLTPEQVRRHPRTSELHADVADLMAGTPVLKVKLYDIGGLTVFSTDLEQIGQDSANNPRFLKAMREESASKLEFRENFSGFSGPLRDRYVLSSYIPVRPGGGANAIEGVVEIYSDVTDFHAQVVRRGVTQIAVVTVTFATVFALLILAVWYAERLIRRHHARSLELTRNVAKAEAASRAKTEFLTNMGHELRTPLNAVIGLSELLRTEPLGPLGQGAYKEYAQHIHENGSHLLDIINDVLTLSEVESGKIEIAAESVEQAALIGSVCDYLRAEAKAKGVTLKTDLQPGVPAIRTDPARLREIVVNLLSNAVKFTPSGGSVTVRLSQSQEAGSTVVTVSDTGIGIKAEDIPLALSAFGQVDGSLSRDQLGTGLGLPLAMNLAEALGGTLEIQSEPGKGTSVKVILPIDGPTGHADPAGPAKTEATAPEPARNAA